MPSSDYRNNVGAVNAQKKLGIVPTVVILAAIAAGIILLVIKLR